jgi:hypothetical protein
MECAYLKIMRSSLRVLCVFTLVTGCLRQDEWSVPEPGCTTGLSPNTTLIAVLEAYPGETLKIIEDWVVEAYVISSDQNGNFFNVLHLQDKSESPESGVEIWVDMRDSHLFYPPGQAVWIKLRGLYLGKSKGIYKLGSAYTSFGNLQVGRIPKNDVPNHVFKRCEAVKPLLPVSISIPDLVSHPANTLVRISDLEFAQEVLDSTFAQSEVPTLRRLLNCQDNEIDLLTSGYSDFNQDLVPTGKGTVTALYYPESGKATLVIRSPADLDLTGERCEDLITEFTSRDLLITELADPDNNPAARFVELYYAGVEPLSLNGWNLERYTNASTERGSVISLAAITLHPGEFLLIASDAVVFEETYGFPPHIEGGPNSPADSNGDDNLVLVDPFGEVIDIFGSVGEDGSGTAHEFEDGRAFRKAHITQGNPVFDPLEWDVYNDTGAMGTVNQPQLAPEDYTPGSRD